MTTSATSSQKTPPSPLKSLNLAMVSSALFPASIPKSKEASSTLALNLSAVPTRTTKWRTKTKTTVRSALIPWIQSRKIILVMCWCKTKSKRGPMAWLSLEALNTKLTIRRQIPESRRRARNWRTLTTCICKVTTRPSRTTEATLTGELEKTIISFHHDKYLPGQRSVALLLTN